MAASEARVLGSVKECYMCLCSHESSDLICPCLCRSDGAPRWVHRACLDRWRRNTYDERYFTNCRECGFQFRFVVAQVDAIPDRQKASESRRRRALGAITRNFFLSALAIQCTLGVLALLIRLVDQHEELVELLDLPQEDAAPPVGEGNLWDALYYRKITYYISACVLGLILLGVVCTFGWIARKCRQRRSRARSHAQTQGIATHPDCFFDTCCYWTLFGSDCVDLCHFDCCRGSDGCGECCRTCQESSHDVVQCSDGVGKGCDCGCDSCGSGEGMIVCCVVFAALIVMAFFCAGIVAAIMVAFAWIHRSWQKFLQVTELKHLSQEFVVEDLSPYIAKAQPQPQPQPPANKAPEVQVVGATVIQMTPEQAAMDPSSSPVVKGWIVPEPTAREKEVQNEALIAAQSIHGYRSSLFRLKTSTSE